MQENPSIKKLPRSQIEFSVTVSWKDMERFIEKVAAEYSQKHPIAGFRPGKAPVSAVEGKIGSALYHEAAESAIKSHYTRFVIENKLAVVGPPSISLDGVKKDADLTFKATVAVFPEIKLCDPKEIKLQKPTGTETTVSDKEINEALEKLRRMRSKIITVNRPAQSGDRVEVDFTLFLRGVPFEGGSGKQYPVIIGEGKFLPEFEQQLIGMEREEKKRFELTFPADYHAKELQKKKGEFEVIMKLVQIMELPELNDEFAKNVGKFKDVTELKDSIRKGIAAEKKSTFENKRLEIFFDKLIAESPVEIPEVMVQEELNKMYHELEHNVAGIGLPMDEYLRQIKKTKDDLLEGWQKDAAKRISVALAIREIAKKQKIEKEIDKEMISRKTAEMRQELAGFRDGGSTSTSIEEMESYARNLLINEKAIDWIKKELLNN